MSGSRILILRDSPDERDLLSRSLSSHHRLFFAATVQEAEIFLAEQGADLIISRAFLKHENMFAFLRKRKEHSAWCKIPFICFSGNQTPVARQLSTSIAAATRAMGADGFISIDDFCQGESYDILALKEEIEKYIPDNNKVA